MGLILGNLPVRIRKIVMYTLSATDQKFFVKFFTRDVPNLSMRAVEAAIPILPSSLFIIWLMHWSSKEYKRSLRKNPKLYENDT
ncbi:Cytochrome b-c1 complex subunit 8 [Anthophora plagiata]